MKCSKCGKELAEGSLFCNYCGQQQELDTTAHELKKQQNAESVVTEHVEENNIKPTFFSKYKYLILLLLAVVVGIAIWLIFFPNIETVESSNGWKHQIGDFGTCDAIEKGWNCNKNATQRCYSSTFEMCFCDEHWETDGQALYDHHVEKASKEGKTDNEDRESDAKVCAVMAVKEQLKAPSTADFCSYTDMETEYLGSNRWKITGYVDAQNSFGAALRENWTVYLTLTEEGYKECTVNFD